MFRLQHVGGYFERAIETDGRPKVVYTNGGSRELGMQSESPYTENPVKRSARTQTPNRHTWSSERKKSPTFTTRAILFVIWPDPRHSRPALSGRIHATRFLRYQFSFVVEALTPSVLTYRASREVQMPDASSSAVGARQWLSRP